MTDFVAVTGAEGFIGSHLAEALVAAGYRVRAMAQYNSFSSYGWLETLRPTSSTRSRSSSATSATPARSASSSRAPRSSTTWPP